MSGRAGVGRTLIHSGKIKVTVREEKGNIVLGGRRRGVNFSHFVEKSSLDKRTDEKDGIHFLWITVHNKFHDSWLTE